LLFVLVVGGVFYAVGRQALSPGSAELATEETNPAPEPEREPQPAEAERVVPPAPDDRPPSPRFQVVLPEGE
jgi:hypothetical protein